PEGQGRHRGNGSGRSGHWRQPKRVECHRGPEPVATCADRHHRHSGDRLRDRSFAAEGKQKMDAAKPILRSLAPDLDRPWLSGAARLFVLILVCTFVAILTRHPARGFVFLNANNLLNVIRNASILIIIGVGQPITLTAKDVDLSFGSVISLTSVVAAIMMNRMGIYFPVAMATA